MSSDGRYVLFTSASALDPTIPAPSPMTKQLWMRDVVTGQCDLISVTVSGGYAANFGAITGSFPNAGASPDGRFVAFEAITPEFVASDTNGRADAFVRDRWTGISQRISLSASGAELTDHSYGTRVSDDGRYALFTTRANDVVPGVDGGLEHLYLRDLTNATTELIARHSLHGSNGEIHADLSADGAFATFQGLLPGDTNGAVDVYVRDRVSGTLTLESADAAGTAVVGYAPKLSADGSVVAFISTSPTLVPGDTNGRADIFVRTRSTGAIHAASRHSIGQLIGPSEDSLTELFLSADGQHVAFYTRATNLVDGDVNTHRYDVFAHDVATGVTDLVSVDSNGQQSPHSITIANMARGISADGQRVLFDSIHAFTPDDTSTGRSLFLHDRSIPTPRAYCFGTDFSCPCSNEGAAGYGCGATNAIFGLRLTSYGSATVSNDSLVLQTAPLDPGVPALFFQGTARVNGGYGTNFGDGVRCAGGTTTRLGTKSSNSSFYLTYGGPVGDTPISVRGNVPATGATRHYQVWFRNAAEWCTTSTFNTSSGLSITWLP